MHVDNFCIRTSDMKWFTKW